MIAASPHLGAWEMAALEDSRRHPIVTMFRLRNNERDDVMNRGLEKCNRRFPPQYWWGYASYRRRLPSAQPIYE